MSPTDCFKDVPKITYRGPESDDPLSYRFYNPDEEILGKKMKDWLRFSVCFWHTFHGAAGRDPFGEPTYHRPWEHGIQDPIEIAKKRIDAAFEMITKLGVQYYTFHDVDVAPEGETLEETQRNLDIISDYLLLKQQETGVKPLWVTQNLFSHPRWMNGAMTSPQLDVFAYGAACIQKALDIGHKLEAEGHVWWGGREGYFSLLNTDMRKELDHTAAMLHLAVDYKQRKGYTAQFYLEPKPREPAKHQYDYDAATCMSFLAQYGLSEHFKLNIEPNHTTLAGHAPEHDIAFASQYGMLGSIDSNTGDVLLGWDTDNFPMDVREATAIMGVLIKQGGFTTGGLNFDCKVRRESTEPVDIFIGHIGAMDTYALGLRKAAKMHEDGILSCMLKERYMSWTSDLGQKIEQGRATLEEVAEYARNNKEPKAESGKQELYEVIRNRFLYSG